MTENQNRLTIALIQSRVHWHRPQDNRAMFEDKIGGLTGEPDLIVLPETFSSGFTQQPEVCSETMDGEGVAWMRRMAAATGAAVAGSLAVQERGAYYNRFLFVTADGVLAQYDKRHLFSFAGEDRRYRPGQARVVFDYRGWRICPQICYDLRFPVWSRCRNDYDLLLYVANWPLPRRHAWSRLLVARAIENQCYVVGLNRVGDDGNGWTYAGESVVVDFLGDPLLDLGTVEGSGRATLDRDRLFEFRRQFAFWQDADDFELQTQPRSSAQARAAGES